MTQDEAIEKMKQLPTDAEGAHILADRILLDFLRSNGFGALADAHDALHKRVGFLYA